MTTPMHHSTYRPYIDGLRAIAVLAVVLYHFDKDLLPGGFAGVDVFFVISGFVVTESALSRGYSRFPDFLADFMARRIRRIVPALLVCLIATSLACTLWIPSSWLSDSIPRTGRYAFFGLANVTLARGAGDYFSPVMAFNPFAHTWSLGVEEQFYVLAPLFFWAWLRGGHWRTAGAVLFVAAVLASYSYAWILGESGAASAYYLLSARFWELAVGVALCVYLRRHVRVSQHRWLRIIQACVPPFALLMLTAGLSASGSEGFTARGAWVPVIATAALLGGLHGTAASSVWSSALAIGPLRYIGKMSYSLYLWHWPVIVLFRWTVGLQGFLHVSLAGTLVLMLSWLSWRLVEQPFRTLVLPVGPRRVIIFGVLVLGCGAGVAQALHKQQFRLSPSTVAKHRDDWYPSRGQRLSSSEGCSVSPRRTDLMRGWHHTFERRGCPFPASGPRVFAIGDSHALAYGPMFARYAMETGSPVTVYNNGGCPLLSLQPERETSRHCSESIELAVADMLPRLRPSDVVFLPSLRLPRYVDQGWITPDGAVVAQVASQEAHEARSSATGPAMTLLRRLRDTGASVVIQAPNLLLKAPAFRCADWWTKSNPICAAGVRIAREEFLALRAPVLFDLNSLVAVDKGVSLFDPVPSLCPDGERCEGFRNGRPLFFDGDHLSAYGNHVIYPAFLAAMQSLGDGSSERSR